MKSDETKEAQDRLADPGFGSGTSATPVTGRPEGKTRGGSLRDRFGFDFLASMRHRDFRFLLVGITAMSAGAWVQRVTLNWLIYDLSGSTILLGALDGLRSLPYLFLALHVGILSDRMDRRRLLITLQPVFIISTATLGFLIVSGRVQIWHLFVFALVSGIAWTISQPLNQAMVPGYVPSKNIANALSLTSMGFNVSKILGPALGGILIASIGPGGNFFVQSSAYTLVLFMLFSIQKPTQQIVKTRETAFQGIKEGLSYVRANPAVLGVIITAMVPPLFAMPYLSLMPVVQKDVLHVGPEQLGFMLAAPGVGALFSLGLFASVGDRIKRKGLLMLGGLGLYGVFIVLFSRVTSYPLVLLPLIGTGFCQLTYLVTSLTSLQLLTPDHLRGRALSLYYMNRGIGPAGALLAGVMANYLGAPLTLTIMGSIVVLLAAGVAWRAPQIHTVET